MLNDNLKIIVLFLFLIVIQGFFLNNFTLFGYINPYLYVLVILILPVDMSKFFIILFSFILGLSIDTFSNTLGMHASACVFVAFMRPLILKVVHPRDGFDHGSRILINNMGLGWYLKYAFLMIIVHHSFLFFIEIFRFTDFFFTFSKVIMTTLFSLVFIIISQYLFFGTSRSN